MTDIFETETNQTKLAVAILVSCIAQTLRESDPTFRTRLEGHVGEAYAKIRDRADQDCREILIWTGEFLRTDDPDSLLDRQPD